MMTNNSNRQSNFALHTVPSTSTPARPAFELDELIRRAFDGERAALDAIVRELHPRLVREARVHLGDLDSEPEDAVQDLFLAILEKRVRAPRGRGECLAHLLRMTAVFARRHGRPAMDRSSWVSRRTCRTSRRCPWTA